MWLLLLLVSAHAITHPSEGAWLEVGGHGAGFGPPLAAAAGWQASAGRWWGHHDEAYALGRFRGVGVEGRQGYGPAAFGALTLDYRQGKDVLVVKAWWGAGAGLASDGVGLGGCVRVSAGLKYRFRPHLGVLVRADVLGLWVDQPSVGGGLGVGLEWAAPRTKAKSQSGT